MIRMSLWKRSVAALFFVLIPRILRAESPTFEKNIFPIFENRCAACHFPDAEELKGDLCLATVASALKGGKKGPAIVPGKADESLLVKLIEGKEEPRMPPKKFKPLQPEEIAQIKQWINEGAKTSSGAIATPAKVADATPEKSQSQPGPLRKLLGSSKKSQPAAPAPVAAPAKPEPSKPAGPLAQTLEPNSKPKPSASSPAASAKNSAHAEAPPIGSLAYSPKGDLLARGGLHKVELLSADPQTGLGQCVAALEGHADLVRGLAFSPDGAFLAAVGGKPSRGGEIKIWKVADHSLVRTITGHADNIFGVAYNPDGKLLATCSYDKMIKLWDAATGNEVHNLKDHVDAVYAVAFSPDGKTLASASGDRTVKIWEVESGKRILTLSDSLGPVYAVAFDPSGKRVAAGGMDKMIRVWDVEKSLKNFSEASLTGATLLKSSFAHDAAVLHLIYSPDGKTIYTASEDKRIKAWNAETLLESATYEPQSDWVMALALSPDGQRLAAGRYDASSAIYEAASGRLLSATNPRPAPGPLKGFLKSKLESKEQKSASGERKKIKNLDVDNVIINAKIPASLQSISPNRSTRGTTHTLEVRGISLDDPEPLFSNPNLTVKLVKNEKLKIAELKRPPGDTGAFIVDNAQPHKLKMDLTVGKDTPVGTHYLMFRTPTGITNAMEFTVVPWADTGEKEPNDATAEAQVIPIPATIGGSIGRSGDVDKFKFQAKEGEELVFVVTDTALQPLLKIMDEGGKVLASSDDKGGDATRLGHKFAAAGDFIVELSDKNLGSAGYRLHVGDFSYVTEFFPLGVKVGAPQKIQVKGFNLGGASEIEVKPPDDAKPGQTMALPIPGVEGNPIPAPQVALLRSDEIQEAEPNDDAKQAQVVPFPVTINGKIKSSAAGVVDQDHYRFSAKKGQKILIEVSAARQGSELDSVIDILEPDGKPLELATVRCTAQSVMSLSDRDSKSAGIRIADWTDMKIGDYIMIGSEIIRVRSLPGYADEDVVFQATATGQRIGYFGTTPEHHAVNTPVYKVEIHPPGTTFAPNGMPVYTLYWRNDDVDFEGAPPGDSFLEFVPPRDGDFILRIKDADERGGDNFAYRLMFRSPQPDYDIVADPYWPNVPAGDSVALNVRARRRDGFSEPIEVKIEGLPEGYSAENGVILSGEDSINLALKAAPDAKSSAYGSNFKAVARSVVDGKEAKREAGFGAVTIRQNPDIHVKSDVQKVALEPGQTGNMMVTLDRFNGVTSRVPLSVLNLPFGVRVLDTGLNGILVREDENDRPIRIFVEPWVQPLTRTIHVQARIETRSTSPVFLGPPIELKIGNGGSKPGSSIAAGNDKSDKFLDAVR